MHQPMRGSGPARYRTGWFVLAAAGLLSSGTGALACDGKNYSFTIAAGDSVSGGGLTVRLDKAKFFNDIPDKYYISVKDGDTVLADHAALSQFNTIDLKTSCGTVSIGANRKSMFSSGTLMLRWSYF